MLVADCNSTEPSEGRPGGADESDAGSSDNDSGTHDLEPTTASSQPSFTRGALLNARERMIENNMMADACVILRTHLLTKMRTAGCFNASSSLSNLSAADTDLQSPFDSSTTDGFLQSRPPVLLETPCLWTNAHQKQHWGRTAHSSTDAPSDTEVKRHIKAILNKLTPEKFDTLYMKLMNCRVDTVKNVEMLAEAVYLEAISQPPFSAMYADLCAYLIADLGEWSFALRHKLVGMCWHSFERSLEGPSESEACDGSIDNNGAEEEIQIMQKAHMLGNVRFMGELFIRNLIFPHELFICTGQFLKMPITHDNLERLVALLNVAGPAFDDVTWSEHSHLQAVFWHIRGLTFDPAVPKRVRCLLRDLIDLRDAGWVDMKYNARKHGPKRLEDVTRGSQ